MRGWVLHALLVLVLLAPAAAAQGDTFHLAAGAYRTFSVEAREGSEYRIHVRSDVPLDVLLVQGSEADYLAGNATRLVERLNSTDAQADGAFPSSGPWTLVLDNSHQPADGANGTTNATVTADLVWLHPTPVDPRGPVEVADPGSKNPWPVIMLTSPYWDLGLVGLGGMALWFLLLAALAAIGYNEGWSKVGVLALGVGLLIALWALVPHRGAAWNTVIPLMLAGGVAWLAYRGAADGRQGLRMGFLGAGLGALLGVAVGHLLRALWSDPGMMLLGAERFDDPVFMMPLAAGFGALLLALITALVEASEDEEQAAKAGSPGLTQSFTVHCLRCGTPIKVDRSMKKYRVAMDRYEFPCPNCHAWMEWAEPKPEGAAAA